MAPGSRPRLKDVADIAGVSTATVSRVVNDRPGVSDDIREKVSAALQADPSQGFDGVLKEILPQVDANTRTLQARFRDHTTKQRRPFLRFFACAQDLSHESPDEPLPEAVATGEEPFAVVGAMAGG